MFHLGLVSVSLRSYSAREIISLCVAAKLENIEWGGDIHVPPGNLKNAREVGKMTRDSGLSVAAYGSYYRCDGSNWESVLENALELGAPLIRVWAGTTDAHDAADTNFSRISDDLNRICSLAKAQNIEVATEFHGGTLTSSGQSTLRLLNLCPSAKTLWQPLQRTFGDAKVAANLHDLQLIEPKLSNVHVYEWSTDPSEKTRRHSLKNSGQWSKYIQKLQDLGGQRNLLLEFLPDDNAELLVHEAEFLRALVQENSG